MEYDKIDVWDYFKIIAKRKWVILTILLLFIIITTIVSFIRPPIYLATATIKNNEILARADLEENLIENSVIEKKDLKNYFNTELLKKPEIKGFFQDAKLLESIIANLNMDVSIKKLKKGIYVDAKTPEIIKLKVKYPGKGMPYKICKILAGEYISKAKEEVNITINEVQEDIDNKIAELKLNCQLIDNKIEEEKQYLKKIQSLLEQTINIETVLEINRLNDRVKSIELRVKDYQKKLDEIDNLLAGSTGSYSEIERHMVLFQLKQKLQSLKEKRQDLLNKIEILEERKQKTIFTDAIGWHREIFYIKENIDTLNYERELILLQVEKLQIEKIEIGNKIADLEIESTIYETPNPINLGLTRNIVVSIVVGLFAGILLSFLLESLSK